MRKISYHEEKGEKNSLGERGVKLCLYWEDGGLRKIIEEKRGMGRDTRVFRTINCSGQR